MAESSIGWHSSNLGETIDILWYGNKMENEIVLTLSLILARGLGWTCASVI